MKFDTLLLKNKIFGIAMTLSCLLIHFQINAGSLPIDNIKRPEAQILALDYIKALTARNYQALATFYSRDTHFYDKTAGKRYTGGRHIIDFFKRAHADVESYQFNIEHMYNSGSFVVMIGNYHLVGAGKQFGKPGKTINIAVPGVTTVKLDLTTHRIKQHTDFIDYQTMADQLATQ